MKTYPIFIINWYFCALGPNHRNFHMLAQTDLSCEAKIHKKTCFFFVQVCFSIELNYCVVIIT